MKKAFFISIALSALAAANGQNSVNGPMGVYTMQYNAATLVLSGVVTNGGSILVGTGGNWYLGGNITSNDKGNPNSPNSTGQSEVITFDATGTYSNAATVPGTAASSSGYIIDGYGGTTATIGSSFLLPLGNTTSAYPITVPASTAITTAYFNGSGSSVANASITNATGGPTTVFSQYYDIPSGFAAGSYTISYPSGLTPGKNAILKSSDQGATFKFQVNVANFSTSASTVTASLPDPSATRLYTSTSTTALPISILSFAGAKTNSGNLLSWSASNAVNFGHFELQRKADGGTAFSTIATLGLNAGGSYTYTDAGAIGTNYYRLAMVDLDGTIQYSNTVAIVGDGSSFAVASIYPNPATSQLNIALYTPTATNVTYTITDISGRVMGKEVHAASAATTQAISVSNLARGTYLITVDANGTKTTSKFTKL